MFQINELCFSNETKSARTYSVSCKDTASSPGGEVSELSSLPRVKLECWPQHEAGLNLAIRVPILSNLAFPPNLKNDLQVSINAYLLSASSGAKVWGFPVGDRPAISNKTLSSFSNCVWFDGHQKWACTIPTFKMKVTSFCKLNLWFQWY